MTVGLVSSQFGWGGHAVMRSGGLEVTSETASGASFILAVVVWNTLLALGLIRRDRLLKRRADGTHNQPLQPSGSAGG